MLNLNGSFFPETREQRKLEANQKIRELIVQLDDVLENGDSFEHGSEVFRQLGEQMAQLVHNDPRGQQVTDTLALLVTRAHRLGTEYRA